MQAEALRLALVRAGTRYRTLFAWLLTAVRRMTEEDPAAAQRHSFQMDTAALAEFLRGQLFSDAIGPQLSTVVWAHTEIVLHSTSHAGTAFVSAAILELSAHLAVRPPTFHCMGP